MKIIYVFIVMQWFSIGLMAQTPVMPQGNGSEATPYRIENLENLYWITVNPQHWDKSFVQTTSIDASETRNWFEGQGWIPIGTSFNQYFSGNYDGNNFFIRNLYINRPDMENVGLFGYVRSSDWDDIKRIQNLWIVDVDIAGRRYVGALAGVNSVYMINCFSSGMIRGLSGTGGLVGLNRGFIENSYSIALVSGEHSTGGLAGANVNGSISISHAISNVTGTEMTGGLVGYNYDASITKCYFEGIVQGTVMVGGLAGVIRDESPVRESFSIGSVSGQRRVGGLVGLSFYASINNSYSRSNVVGDNSIGGLAGECYWGLIEHSYSTGIVMGNLYTGGLIGQKAVDEQIDPAEFDISNYWDTKTSGKKTSAMGQGRTTGQMTIPFAGNTYKGWDFHSIWKADSHSNDGYPYLSWQQFDEEPVDCAMGQGYWFARPHTQWPYDVVIGGHRFSQKEAKKKFWPANSNTKRAFTQYTSIYLSGTAVSHFPVLEKSMKIIEYYFTHQYPAPADKEVNKAASDIGKWIDRNSCEEVKTKSEMAVKEPNALMKVYPNPFRDKAFIGFTSEKEAFVNLAVYNALGEKIVVLFNGQVQAGQPYKLTFDASMLPNGLYLSRLFIGDELFVEKLFLTR